jgi:hypothetical protein
MENKFKKGSLAISQIGILVIALFAFAFLIGGIGVVSAGDACTVGDKKCSGNDVEECVLGGEGKKTWKTTESCPDGCSNGKCTEVKKDSNGGKIIASAAGTAAPIALKSKGLKAWITKTFPKLAGGGKTATTTISGVEGASPLITGIEAGPTSSTPLGSFLSLGQTSGVIIQGFIWAVALGIAARYIGELAGLNVRNAQNLGWSVAGGVAGATVVFIAIGSSGPFAPFVAIGAAIGAAFYFLALHKNAAQEIVSLQCNTWQAPLKGENCELCNDYELGCTEYQCKSLGQGCDFINDDGENICIWNSRNDISPPIVSPWESVLLASYKYTPDKAISPPNRGVQVESNASDGCAKAFTPISFGLTSNEPARCKVSPISFPTFEDMPNLYMDGVGLKYNHSFALSLPSNESLSSENITLENGGQYTLYTRCQDANGNSNDANFVFKYCVDEGPDTSPPLIVYTSALDGAPIPFGQTSMNIEVYVNEPATCKWDMQDKSYDDMSSIQYNGSGGLQEKNANLLYTIPMNLTGLKDRINNRFYIRCKDRTYIYTKGERPSNENRESYVLNLQGTEPLIITEVGPNATTMKDSTEIITVKLKAKTSGGSDSGKAMCSYSETGEVGSYFDFFYGYDTKLHSQYEHENSLGLGEESYNYYIQCCDLGNNCDTKQISFDIEIDREEPLVVRAFHDSNYLKIITNEEATCVYDTQGNNYAYIDGTEMTALNGGLQHFTKWDSKKTFYIKCADTYGNQPDLQTDNSIIVKPFEA